MKRWITMLLAVSMLLGMLTGCAFDGLGEQPEGTKDPASGEEGGALGEMLDQIRGEEEGSALDAIKDQVRDKESGYARMEYKRPDMEQLEESLQAAIDAANAGDLDLTMDNVYGFYDDYDWFYTNYYLADIRYSGDLTDSYWEEEYSFCMANSARVDAALEELYYALAASPIRKELDGDDYFGPDFLKDYDGENAWDDAFTALLEQEAALENRYYELSEISLNYAYGSEAYYRACGNEMVELMVQLIGLRQEIAAYMGYDSYVDYATDNYYYRDYTAEQTLAYLEEITEELVPLYEKLNRSVSFYVRYGRATEVETFAYVRDTAENMGGTVWEAFQRLEEGELYDIAYSENKYNASFEVYLTSYADPFVFMNPSQDTGDYLTFAHEFGHFCNDFAAEGCYAGIDVLEVFSQAMEYLSLIYAPEGEDLVKLKMWDSLRLFVEQSAFASFEMRMYDLKGDDLNAENLRALYEEVAKEFGFESIGYDDREFTMITHFYTNPMYVISYVVSNDLAMQMYQMELEESGAGLKCMEENLDTEASYFLEFVESAGLQSPFEEGRLETVRQTLEAGLK